MTVVSGEENPTSPTEGIVVRHQLEAFAEQVLGPCRTVRECSWPHRGPCVLEIRDAEDTVWYAKAHRYEDNHLRELTAYQRWVPALQPHAPTLRASDADQRMLLFSAVPGSPLQGVDVEVHHRAGVLLRRLHAAENLPSDPGYAASKQAELERWAARSDGLLDARELDFARAELRSLAELPAADLVPCHLDYSPRNWLVVGERVSIIDFEWAKPEVWVNDLARLFFGPWRRRPELRESFLDGYGRSLEDADVTFLLANHAFTTVWQLIWSHHHDNHSFATSTRQLLHALMRRDFDRTRA